MRVHYQSYETAVFRKISRAIAALERMQKRVLQVFRLRCLSAEMEVALLEWHDGSFDCPHEEESGA